MGHNDVLLGSHCPKIIWISAKKLSLSRLEQMPRNMSGFCATHTVLYVVASTPAVTDSVCTRRCKLFAGTVRVYILRFWSKRWLIITALSFKPRGICSVYTVFAVKKFLSSAWFATHHYKKNIFKEFKVQLILTEGVECKSYNLEMWLLYGFLST